MTQPATALDFAEGFKPGMPNETYHAHESISKSGLDKVHISPAHYKDQPPREPTQAMRIGSAIHCAVLEPDLFDKRYLEVNFKDRRTKAYKETAQAHGEEFVLLPHEAEHVRAVQKSIHAHPEAKKLITQPGDFEMSAFARDPETGVKVRCRYDLLCSNFALDLKKSRGVMPREFSRACATYRYHVQAAFYSDVYEWITGEKLEAFWFLAVEDQPPYTPVLYRLDDISLEQGRIDYRRDLNTYAMCLESGEWPKFEPETSLLSLPDWALADMDDALEIM